MMGDHLTKSRTGLMHERLRLLQQNSPDLEGAAVVSADGLIMASVLPQDSEEDRVAAMSAAMLSLGDRIAEELRRGELEQVYIRGKVGYVLLSAVGPEAVLTILARSDARLGLLLLEARLATRDLLTIL